MNKKKAILSCISSLVLCSSLIVGSTYALFTSESKKNIAINSGSVEVVATLENLSLYSPESIATDLTYDETVNGATATAFKNGGTAELTEGSLKLNGMTPGDKATVDVKLKNKSTVDMKYRTVVGEVNDGGLFSSLVVKIDGKQYADEEADVKSPWTLVEANAAISSDVVQVSVELPVGAGNECQGKSAELAITVSAVQANASMVDRWDGTLDNEGLAIPDLPESETPTTPAEESKKVIYIDTAEQLAALAANVNAGTSYAGYTVKLTEDLDLENREWTPIGTKNKPFQGSFDGQGHTIYNLYIYKEIGNIADSNRQGLFGTIVPDGETRFENLILHNANVQGGYHVGAVIAASDNSNQTATGAHLIVSNVKLTGKVTVEGWQGVGGVMGSGNMAELSNIEVNVEEGSYVSNTVGGLDNSFNIVGSVKGGGYLSTVKNITSNLDVRGKCVSIGGLFGIIGGQNSVICALSNVSYSGTVTVMTSTELQWGYGRHQYNGLIIGAPRFNVVAEQATCTSTGRLELHTEEGIKTSNDMGDAYTWGVDLFGASRDNVYTNKSYAKAYSA